MTTLLVIADDFTGALDTAVQFSKLGISTLATTRPDYPLDKARADVLVVETDTRHRTPDAAYQIVRALACKAREAGIPHIYKKTDSALRGNIGAELTAVADAYAAPLYFLPAFPSMGRTTRHGIHYIGKDIVSRSAFAQDPFEPVRESHINKIIRRQSDIPVVLCKPEKVPAATRREILVIDSSREEDFDLVCKTLKLRRYRPALLGGCAGFAACLPGLLDLRQGEKAPQLRARQMLVLSGSVNPVSFTQQKFAQKAGFALTKLMPREKREEDFFTKEVSEDFWLKLEKKIESGNHVLVSVAENKADTKANDREAKEHGISVDEVRRRVARNIGQLGKELNRKYPDLLLFIVGGDTLHAYLEQTGTTEIVPQAELVPGVVQSLISTASGPRHILTKSGGLSDRNVYAQTARIICSPRADNQ